MLDTIIKNGTIIDPARRIHRIGDIGILEGRIVDLREHPGEGAVDVVDASGCFVTPGIIDFHVHAYTDGTERGIYPESTCFPVGVTTIVDGGSAGVANYELFRNSVIAMSKVRIKALLNMCSMGLGTVTYPENVNPEEFNISKIKNFYRKYGDNIIGLKVRQSREIAGKYGLEPLRKMVETASPLGAWAVVHVTNSPGTVEETLDLLRPGDIFCHVYHGKGNTILGPDGKVLPAVWEARKRGVLFDAAHGGNQFSNRVAQTALEQGFLPDFITSDISLKTMYRDPLYSMGNVMSKFLNLGLSIDHLVEIVCKNPAEKLGMSGEIGTLAPGACADVAVHRIVDHEMEYNDSHGVRITGTKVLRTLLTFREGVTVFRQTDF